MHEQSERSVNSSREGLALEPENKPPVVACSLGSADYQARRQRFADLNRQFLLGKLQYDLSLELTYSSNAAPELRDLLRLEEECCPFLRFQFEPSPNSIKLSITVPESARDSADALLEPFLTP